MFVYENNEIITGRTIKDRKDNKMIFVFVFLQFQLL